MAYLNALRRRFFWYFDKLKGSPIKKHYLEISEILESPLQNKSKKTIKLNLSKLLDHAVETTPFYHNFKEYKSVQDFPIIDKAIILDNYNRFKSSLYKNSELSDVFSSGSTGIPFCIKQNKEKRYRNTADVIFFLEQAGGIFGDRLFYIKLWDYKNRKGRVVSWIQNIYMHNVMDNTDDDIKSLVLELEKNNLPKNIIGYPSFFEELSNYLKVTGQMPKVSGLNTIISFAESLKDRERKLITKFFDCQVYERYSNQENGILAQKTVSEPDIFTLNLASYYFEVLETNSDKHVRSGNVGRLVVTDLFNYAMPLIRYDTGDMVVYEETDEGRPFISSVFGRRMDTIFDIRGRIVSPHIFYMILDFGEMVQFQFIQKNEKCYEFKINGLRKNVRENEASEYFKKYLGKDAVISFDYVDEIPLLSSGKRKKIVNEMKKS